MKEQEQLARAMMQEAIASGANERFGRKWEIKNNLDSRNSQKTEAALQRRAKVREMLLKGYTKRRIAAILDCHRDTIGRDIAAIRKEMAR